MLRTGQKSSGGTFIDPEGNSGGFVSSGGMRDMEGSAGAVKTFGAVSDDRDALDTWLKVTSTLMLLSIFTMLWALIFLPTSGYYIAFVLLICLGAFAYALFLAQWILGQPTGSVEMKAIADYIRKGAEGYLKTQYTAISYMAAVTSVILFLIYLYRQPSPHVPMSQSGLGLMTACSFMMGAFCSALAGYFGVWTSVRCNLRCAAAAARGSTSDSLKLAFSGGAVSAIVSSAMCILGVCLLYCMSYSFCTKPNNIPEGVVPIIMSGYGFGASFVALFMQLGGGIYTKAADVGADMIGKIEAGIPEDDPRNAAVIADLVGDNVGDCAGSMADVFESIAAEILGTMILGADLAKLGAIPSPETLVFFPLVVHAADLVVSSAGIALVNMASEEDCRSSPLAVMKKSYAVSATLAVVIFFFICKFMLTTAVAPSFWFHMFLCGLVGIGTSYLLVLSTQYFTDYAYKPVRSIAKASETGHGTNIIAGVAVGMESTGPPITLIAIAILSAYQLGVTSGLPSFAAGLYGTASATMGMLCTAVFILSMNNFGPISDNAGGIVEMSNQDESVRNITDNLDAVGNVTKAATKGYSVGASALACFILFRAFMDEVSVFSGKAFEVINIAKMEVMIGGLLGIMMIFLFSAWAIVGVGESAQEVVKEVRRQFRENPEIMTYQVEPDYKQCVAIVTRSALRQMVKPAMFALFMPVAVGLFFKEFGSRTGRPELGLEVLAGLLMFGTLTALLMATFFDNAGGAWDNAKKYIEAGAHGGKGGECHKAAVTGDTVGDPFKDTAGPALHVIITTMATTTLVLGPLFLGTPK